MYRLPIRERHDGQKRRDDDADWDGVAKHLRTGDDQRGDDEVGGVRDRRERVGRQHSKSRNAREALVVGERGRDRFAEEKTLERRD